MSHNRQSRPKILTSERTALREHLASTNKSKSSSLVEPREKVGKLFPNPVAEEKIGRYRPPESRRLATADCDLISKHKNDLGVLSFAEAGPRKDLYYEPEEVHAAIVTAGGLAPGINCLVHSIVKRHVHTYSIAQDKGVVWGVFNSFKGLCALDRSRIELTPTMTDKWLDESGSRLGNIRYNEHKGGAKGMVEEIVDNLNNNKIDILYVIGGDGSLDIAHRVATHGKLGGTGVIGIPKTMDNDLLWVWSAPGFETTVGQATEIVNGLHAEAESTRGVSVVELFGAESGFVAANASLSSGHVNLVLIPEIFYEIFQQSGEVLATAKPKIDEYLNDCIGHIKDVVQEGGMAPHAVVVVAEGIGKFLGKIGYYGDGKEPEERNEEEDKKKFLNELSSMIDKGVKYASGRQVRKIFNRSKHYIRSVPPNSKEKVFCERLGYLAVDNALAGYSDCMVSQWMTEFVLVPLHFVANRQKCIPIDGMFWKQVVSSTRQPLSEVERIGE